ncbi:hypothetical protein [Dyadobacter fermentans]|uniref:hypothetical protein n=1 Tax=Dyadobacter fermentans TaxID=94254 RepID=UPI001CC065F5|nr:hypothetical protein [Dyadobacter fermentans]MBZ1361649.1 hypothetical protein [Dyadobacter fermentans]
MSTIAEELVEYFNSDQLRDTIARLDGSIVNYGESPNYLIIENFKNAKFTVESAIQKDLFLSIPHTRRVSMRDTMRNAIANRGSTQSFLQSLDNFVDAVEGSSLAVKIIPNIDAKRILSEVRKLTEKYNRLEKLHRDSVSQVDGIRNALSESDTYLRQQTEIISNLNHAQGVADSVLASINEYRKQSSEIVGNVKEYEKEIESKRLSIETFATNIDEYKQTITVIQNEAEAVVNKGSEVSQLIEQAQIALQLNSAEGVSAAFAAQHRNASSGWQLWTWISACVVCLGGALYLTITLISEKHIAIPKDKISPLLLAFPWLIIVGRAVSVSICLSAAAFCARQYTKQKQLAEDYAYKSVLAKSIVAFSQEIKKSDDSNVAEYLTTVLAEIHRDPLRNKLTKNDALTLIDVKSIAEAVVEKMKK